MAFKDFGRIRVLSLDAMNTLIQLREPPGIVYERIVRLHFQKRGQEVPVLPSPEQLTRNFREAFRELERQWPCYAFGRGGYWVWWIELIRRCFAEKTQISNQLANNIIEYYEGAGAWKLKHPAMISEFAHFRRKVPAVKVAVASNYDTRLPSLLAQLGMHAFVDAYFLSGQMGVAKPDFEFFRRIQNHFHLETPDQLLHVGDDERVDFDGARQFGAEAVLLREVRSEATAEEGSDVPFCVQSAPELLHKFYE